MRKPAAKNSKELSPEALNELKTNAIGVLSECRRQLLSPTRSPFIGSIAMNLELKPVRDRRCQTACTDGKTIFFDIAFLSDLSPEDRLFVLAHEVWHNVMCHLTSRARGKRNQMLYNIAQDLEVNQLLKADGYSVMKSACMPHAFDVPENLSAEEYYELLISKCQKKGSSGKGQGPGGGGRGSGKGKGGDGSESGDEICDKHIGPDYNKDEDQDGQGQEMSDQYGKIGDDPDFNPCTSHDEMAKNQEKMRELAVAAAQRVERSRGELPAHLKSLVKGLLKPEIPWQEVLIQFVTRAVGDRNCWSRPNRRFVHSGIYLPSKEGEKINIAVGIDTSGSTAGDIKKFLSEINAIVKNYGNYEVHLIQCDTAVNDYTLYNEDNPLDLEHEEFRVHGMGGTVLRPIFNFIKEKELSPDCITIFTDGYVEQFTENDSPGIPTMWIVTKDGCTDTLGFGEVLKFNDRSENS